jgi:hypothetical protein
LPKLVEVGLELALNSVREKEQAALTDLLVYLATQGELTSEHLIAGGYGSDVFLMLMMLHTGFYHLLEGGRVCACWILPCVC